MLIMSINNYNEYASNHICVYVGASLSPGFWSSNPQEKADRYSPVRDTLVYIDGIEYGSASQPFGAFEVTPGPHVVKVKGYYNCAGIDKWMESKAIQVKVTDKSAFMFFHWNFYRVKGKVGLEDCLFVRTYDNVIGFLLDTHQS